MENRIAKISVIIVNWNSGSALLNSLRAVLTGPSGDECEVILVDNHSQDGSMDLVAANFPEIQTLFNDRNIGTAAASNAGIHVARGEKLLFLSPEIVLRGDAVERLSRFLDDHPEAAAVTGRPVRRDGTTPAEFRLRALPNGLTAACDLLLINEKWPDNRVNRCYQGRDRNMQVAQAIDQPGAPCLMIRRATLESVGDFDEQFYPMGFEGTDWCKRLRAAGEKIYYTPEATFYPMGGLIRQTIEYPRHLEIFHRNMIRYFRKHHGRTVALGVKALLLIGMLQRIVLAPFRVSPRAPHRAGAVRAYMRMLGKSWSF